VLKSEEYIYPDDHEYYYNNIAIVGNIYVFLPSLLWI